MLADDLERHFSPATSDWPIYKLVDPVQVLQAAHRELRLLSRSLVAEVEVRCLNAIVSYWSSSIINCTYPLRTVLNVIYDCYGKSYYSVLYI